MRKRGQTCELFRDSSELEIYQYKKDTSALFFVSYGNDDRNVLL